MTWKRNVSLLFGDAACSGGKRRVCAYDPLSECEMIMSKNTYTFLPKSARIRKYKKSKAGG